MKAIFVALTAWMAVGIFCASTGALRATQLSSNEVEFSPVHWRGDAALRDVFFLNHDLGWAAGDHGTILRTEDGGRSWSLVPVAVSCSLRSIQFVDELNGWAAGGRALPLVDRTHAVLLRTRDGGRTWQSIDGTMLPAIRKLKMSDAQNGWAWGSPTQLFPNGIFVTADGGRSWSDFPQSKPLRWSAVAATRDGFAVATDQARLGLYDSGRFRESRQQSLNTAYNGLVFFDADHAWALGDRQTMATDDGGQNWQSLDIPAETLGPERFEFQTIASSGARRWLAGSPGSYVFCLDQSKHLWSRSRTPIRSAIHKLHFVDERHGWAVGDLGNILVTRDAGETWQVQRSAGDRVGLLFVCRSADSIPFEVLARQSADQGYFAAVVICAAKSVFGDGVERAAEACQRQGVSTFVMLETKSPETAQARLVGLIRQLQPTAIVISDAAARGEGVSPRFSPKTTQIGDRPPRFSDIPEFDLESAVVSAITFAADQNHDRDWINHAALAPWQTPFVRLARKKEIAAAWGAADYLPAIGQNLFDQVLVSRALLTQSVSATEGFELTALADSSAMATTDLFGGLTKGPLAPPQRKELAPRGHVGQIKTIINKSSTLNQLATQFDSSPASLPVWRQRVDRLASDLEPKVAGDWLWQLSESYARNNRLELAAYSRAALLELVPGHPLTWESRLWLASYYSSDEISWSEFLEQQKLAEGSAVRTDSAVRKAGLSAVPQKTVIDGVTQWEWVPEVPSKKEASSDPRADIAAQLPDSASSDFVAFSLQRLKLSQTLFRSINQHDPELATDPLVAFGEALLNRKLEGFVVAESDLRKIHTQNLPQPLRHAIAREQRLVGTKSWTEMRDAFQCPTAAAKPYLDGVLDDGVWRSAAESGRIIQLSPDSHSETQTSTADTAMKPTDDPNLSQTQLMLAHDDQYLYLAAVCHCAPEPAAQKPRGEAAKRQRDQSLDQQDLLQIAIDIDRDCRTYYLFSVDGRGSLGDQLAENRQWNPNWYLAHSRTEHNWIVEAAIPLDQLSPGLANKADEVWGLSVRRHLAGGQVERWSPAFASTDNRALATRFTKPDFLPLDGVIYFR